jgi:hypothetical protein
MRRGSGRDTIAAIIRDPASVYVYWRLEGARSGELIRTAGPGCQWYLRVLNLSDSTSAAIPIDPEARDFYAEVSPGKTYGFELAVSVSGRWRTICRTGQLDVPSAAPELKVSRRGTPAVMGPPRGLIELRPVVEVDRVPGLSIESTGLYLGSSPQGPAVPK